MFGLSPLLTKIIGYVVMGLVVSGLATGAWYSYTSTLSANQRLKDSLAQFEQTVRDQQEFIKKSQEILELSQKATQDLQASIDKNDERFKKLDDFLISPEAAKSDRPASAVIKETLRRIKNEQK